jgi:hypothetical protein
MVGITIVCSKPPHRRPPSNSDAAAAEAERRPRRRYYALTPKGVEALEEAADRLARATRGIRRAAAGSSGR